MLRVNEDKVLQDYCELVTKRDDNLGKIEVDARAYALAHNYSDEKTQKFIAFVLQEIEDNGLSEDDAVKLNILSAYIKEIEEVDEPVDDEVEQSTLEMSYDGNIKTVLTNNNL